MSLPWRALHRVPALFPSTYSICHVRRIADQRPFQYDDWVILRPQKDRNAALMFKRLKEGQNVDTHRGIIQHRDIVGARVRDVIQTTKPKAGTRESASYRLYQVKLEEYVRLTRRLVTPLYPQDARLIVELLDLHPEPPIWHGEGKHEGPKLEILEAGTGHGALTLYLSRAIHVANGPFPRHTEGEEEAHHIGIDAWKASRRAVIHTIEVSPRHSAHAENIVNGFRHGMYHHNVDFHVANVSEWVANALADRADKPFLSHAFLDLPRTEDHMSAVAAALRIDGTLIVFCPSITQIMACVETVKIESLPLDLEKVLELPVNHGAGGREWDVRAVKPKAAQKAEAVGRNILVNADRSSKAQDAGAAEDSGVELNGTDEEQAAAPELESSRGSKNEGLKMVCRPKVGEMIVGGGFLGVFRKQRGLRAGDRG